MPAVGGMISSEFKCCLEIGNSRRDNVKLGALADIIDDLDRAGGKT